MDAIFESPGLIGGIAGLVLGLIDYALFVRFIEPRLEGAESKRAWQGKGARGFALPVVRTAFMLSCFVAFPVVGYFVGLIVLPGFGVGSAG